ncbi:MAG: hypothetical protein K0S09_856 [Sphingobacteriaceae bacterium]|jgi:hypothetical protein|nr:hypothetical protein [Sphingobacteriaceae bacterium]
MGAIEFELNNVGMTARIEEVNLELMYFQVSPERELPFLINYDRKKSKWKCASGIYAVKQEIIEAVGKAIDRTLKQQYRISNG